MNNKIKGTWLDGIGATEDLDSSGERIKVEGIDISSLTQDGTFNYEHKSEEPNQTVGKIMEAKKIIKKEDCENERHEYYWEKAGRKPYLYIAGILFDEFKHPGAISVAAMLNFDKLTDKKKTKNIINFSIEGSRLDKKGMWINKCVARKMTITHQACNKRCIAEILDNPKNVKKISKESLFEIFKKCEKIDSTLKKANKFNLFGTSDRKIKSTAPKYDTRLSFKNKPKKRSKEQYKPITTATGQEREGKPITPKRTMTAQEAKTKDEFKAGDRITYQDKKPKTGKQIYSDPKTWEKSEKSKTKVEKKAPKGVNPDKHERCVKDVKRQGHDVGSAHAICTSSMKKKKKENFYTSNVHKALVAGCAVGTPSSKTGTSALSKNQIRKVFKSLSEDAFSRFEKKEELIKFLTNKLPNSKEVEVNAIAKAVAYVHEKKLEKKLNDLNKAKVDEGKTPREKIKAREKRNKPERKPEHLTDEQYEHSKKTARSKDIVPKKQRKEALKDVLHTHKENKKYKLKEVDDEDREQEKTKELAASEEEKIKNKKKKKFDKALCASEKGCNNG